TGAEGTVDHVAVSRTAKLGANERPTLARLDVLELDDLEDGAFDLDVIAVLELVRGDHVRYVRVSRESVSDPLGCCRGLHRRLTPADAEHGFAVGFEASLAVRVVRAGQEVTVRAAAVGLD